MRSEENKNNLNFEKANFLTIEKSLSKIKMINEINLVDAFFAIKKFDENINSQKV